MAEDLKKEVEAILFAAGRKVLLSELQSILDNHEADEIKQAVKDLKQEYEARDSPLLLAEEQDGWKLTVKEKHLRIVQRINPHTELSKATMETLAVIAWKQPILQSELIRIRTNKAYDHVKELDSMGFLAKERSGRSYKLKLTQKFFEYFDLPDQSAVKELFKDFEDVIPNELKKADNDKEDGDKEGKEEHEGDTLGNLEVYEEPEEPAEIFPEEGENPLKEQLGDLEVFEEEEMHEEESKAEAEEEHEQAEETDSVEEESQEELEREKARAMARELLKDESGEEKEEDEEPDEEQEETGSGPEQEDEEPDEEQEETGSGPEQEEETKKKRSKLDSVIDEHASEEDEEPESGEAEDSEDED